MSIQSRRTEYEVSERKRELEMLGDNNGDDDSEGSTQATPEHDLAPGKRRYADEAGERRPDTVRDHRTPQQCC